MEMKAEEFVGEVDEGEELIDEIRAVRHRISERFGHDPYKLVAYYMECQKEHADRLIPAPEAEDADRSAA
jgi:DNA-directed RNA polymerase beta subunit